MGLRLPIYPYYAAQGVRGKKFDPTYWMNEDACKEMRQFADILCAPAARQIAFNIIPHRGKQKVPTTGWFEPAVFDRDDKDHEGLAGLMTRVGNRGTILVPDLTHVMGKKKQRPSEATRRLMVRFDSEDIELLPLVLNLKDKNYDLREFYRSQVPTSDLFELMPEMARAAVDYLKRAVATGSGKRRPPERRWLVPERPRL